MTAEASYKEPYFQKSLKNETHLIRAIFGLFLNILMSLQNIGFPLATMQMN